MGRALIADPELPNKAKEGNVEGIRTCIACQWCLYNVLSLNTTIACAVNAQVGRERLFDLSPVNKPKKIFVIGEGLPRYGSSPSGCNKGTPSLVIRERSKIGWTALACKRAPGTEEINTFTGYLESEVNRLGVKVQTSAFAKAEDVKKQSPDVVIVATGSKLLRPPMPGIDKSHVVTAIEVLQGIKDVKGKVVILGGGLLGAELAEYLATRGKVYNCGNAASNSHGCP